MLLIKKKKKDIIQEQIKILKQGSLALHKINISSAAYSREPCI
jgi:hypothetical protein